ncbi:MAG: hypothetical protein ACLT2Z_09825 [Eubacterium sp.]
MAYANKIIELAKEKNVQLLFVKMPDESWDVDQHNLIQKLADKNNIKFLGPNIKSCREKSNLITQKMQLTQFILI